LRSAETFIPLAKPRWVEPLAERPERNEFRGWKKKVKAMKTHRETLGHWLLQRITAAFSIPTILIANVSTLILLNILLFWHIHVGIEEILADYVHHEVTRNWILILLRVFCLIIIKYVFVFFVF
jgi:succinate dehydrogenase hydrophobic anchor subunit